MIRPSPSREHVVRSSMSIKAFGRNSKFSSLSGESSSAEAFDLDFKVSLVSVEFLAADAVESAGGGGEGG